MELYAQILVYGSFVFACLFLATVGIAKLVARRIGVRYENTRR